MAERFASAFVALIVAGCAAGKPVVWIEDGVSLSTYRSVVVSEVTNATGQATADAVARALTDDLRARLREQGVALREDASGADPTLVLETRLTAYAPGNALARWVAPGAGTTECRLVGTLLDGRTREQLGVVLSHRTVSTGGLLSAGADQRILGVVASDVADGLARELKPR